MDDFIKYILAMVRPVLTFMGLLVLCFMVYEGKEVPEFFIALVGGMVGWWFYDRSSLHKKRREEGEE